MKCGHCKQEGVTVEHVKACSSGPAPRPSNVITEERPQVVAQTMHFVTPGYYTVVFDAERDDRITIRVRPHWEEEKARKGDLVAAYLAGPDNTSDYVGFAFLTPHAEKRMWNVWKRFSSNERLAHALEVLHTAGPEAAGLEYAMRSGNCYRCGRVLTVPASICRGLGPVCKDLV